MHGVGFVCDAMLGTLARWLRFAGFDTHYLRDCPDAEVAALAAAEGRWLLTRDRWLASIAGPRVLLLRSPGLDAQVAEVVARLDLRVEPGRFFSRCSKCNGQLADATLADVASRVPPFVAAHANRFRECPECGGVYWPGSHVARIEARLRSLFPPARHDPPSQ